MRVSHRVALASALLLARAVSVPLATRALDGVAFYAPSLVTAADAYGPFVVEMRCAQDFMPGSLSITALAMSTMRTLRS
jgi:hypothetical protein